MYLLWRAVRFWTVAGALLYTFTSLTPQVFHTSDWLGKHIQNESQRQAHTSSLAMLHKLTPNIYRAPSSSELLGAADQPHSIKEYHKDAR